MDIGRNDLCPCESGKKYKYCCLGKVKLHEFFWFPDKVSQYSTEKIISILQDMGIDIDEEKFISEAQNFYSAENLSEKWFQSYNLSLKGKIEDFPWCAAIVLWDRLVEDKVGDEQLGDLIQEGWDYLDKRKYCQACSAWLEVWNDLKDRIESEGYKDIKKLAKDFKGDGFLYNWCQELELNLMNAGKQENKFYEKRAQYCSEFVNLLPETDINVLRNMRKGEAESYIFMGKKEQGDEKFKKLIEDHPHWVWSYLGWGDMYNYELDQPQKAKEIYEKIYKVQLEDQNIEGMVKNRIKDLEKN